MFLGHMETQRASGSSTWHWAIGVRRLDCPRGLGVDLAQAACVVAAGGTFARANLQRASNQGDDDSAETMKINKDTQGTSVNERKCRGWGGEVVGDRRVGSVDAISRETRRDQKGVQGRGARRATARESEHP